MIFLAQPSYGAIEPAAMLSVMRATKQPMLVHANTSSMLVDCFNSMWCEMLNTPNITHWAMIHADVGTEPWWIDTFITKMEERNLDVLSAVIPIKDETGDMSTAVLQENDNVRRLNVKDIQQLPRVFTKEDTTKLGIDGVLLVNTGLWVAKCGDWMKTFNGFRADSQIVYKNGKYETVNSPEDWDFSVWADSQGLKVGAISIPVTHWGKKAWAHTFVQPNSSKE